MCSRMKAAALLTAVVLAADTLVTAQALRPLVPGKQVRVAPVTRAHKVGAPVLNEAGSFMPLRSNPTSVSVFGIVQNHAGQLVPNAGTIVLRDIVSGNVVAQAPVNELAQFSIRGLPGGLYSAELVGQSGAVVASSAAFTAGVGEVIQISQTIPVVPLQGVTRVVSSATSSALSSAASSGVLAIADAAPLTPGS